MRKNTNIIKLFFIITLLFWSNLLLAEDVDDSLLLAAENGDVETVR